MRVKNYCRSNGMKLRIEKIGLLQEKRAAKGRSTKWEKNFVQIKKHCCLDL